MKSEKTFQSIADKKVLFGFYHLYRYVLKSEVHMVHIQLVFGPTCAEPIYVD